MSSVSYADSDANGNPIGLLSIFNSSSSEEEGFLIVTLRHQPDKFASGVSDGNIENAGGETDIEITFDLVIM